LESFKINLEEQKKKRDRKKKKKLRLKIQTLNIAAKIRGLLLKEEETF